MNRFACAAAVVLICALATPQPAAAVNLVFDDKGGSPDPNFWSDEGNWNPDNLPDATDDLFIGVNAALANFAPAANIVTIVDQNFSVNSVTLGNGADIVNSIDSGVTSTFIFVDFGVVVGNGTGASVITLYDAPGANESLDANTVTINDGGTVTLDSDNAVGNLAILDVDAGLLDINGGGTLSGNGQVTLTDAPAAVATLLDNDGTISAGAVGGIIFNPPATTLRITATSANARVDLDGSGGGNDGIVNVNRNATLDIEVPINDVFGGDINLSAGATLDILNGWTLAAPGTLDVNTPGIIIGTGGPAAHLAGGTVTMTGGTITLNDALDTLTLDAVLSASGGVINNSGLIIVNSLSTIGNDFNMVGADASLSVNGTLNVDTPDFNLDGPGAATNVTTVNAGGILDLDLGAGADEFFQHTINLNGGELDVTTVDNNWALNAGGVINAGGAAASNINGETFQIIGTGSVNVLANSTLNVNAVTEITGATDFTVAAGGVLNFGSVTYSNAAATFTGAGLLRPGTATIAGATTWDTDTVKLDDGTLTINANLTVNTDAIDIGPVDLGYDGSMTIANAALLTVNIGGGGAWTVDPAGDINYSGDAVENTFLAGSEINLNGILNVTGDGRTDAVLNIGGTVNILTAAEPLRLSGGNTTTNTNTIVVGAVVNGPGLLGADTGSALVGAGTINATVDFDGASNLQAKGPGVPGTLNVNTIVDVGTLGTADATGTLNVIPAWNTNVATLVFLNGGTLQGGAITNDGAAGINGHGTIIASINNNTRIDAEDGGTLILRNQVPANLDGAGAGSLNALTANLTVEYGANTPVGFDGTVRVDAGQEFFGNLTLWNFQAASTLDLNGGRFRSNLSTVINGTVDVAAGPDSTISNPNLARFGSTSSTTLNGNLRLVGISEIQAGATFAGGGSLVNTAGSTLTLADGADVDVLLQNDGTLVLGTSPGQTLGLDFEQTAGGAWNVELGGTGINNYDRMTLTGLAQVDGTLNLSLIGGYVPTLADPLLTILAAASVGGTFDVVNQPPTMPPALMFDVIYNAGNIQLDVVNVLLGDYNRNGEVDTADYPVWRDTLGNVVTAFSGADGDGDGVIDNDDYGVWTAHFGQTAGSGAGLPVAVPEPNAALIALLMIVVAGFCGSRGVLHSR